MNWQPQNTMEYTFEVPGLFNKLYGKLYCCKLIGFLYECNASDVSILQNHQTVSGTQTASYSKGTRRYFLW